MSGSDADLSRQTITKGSEGIHSVLQSRSSSSRDRTTDIGILREGDVDLEREDNLRIDPWWTLSELLSSPVKRSEKTLVMKRLPGKPDDRPVHLPKTSPIYQKNEAGT